MDRRKKLKIKKGWIIGISIFALFSFFIWRTSVFRITKNFEEVDPGKFYRSAQLAPDELQDVITKYGIKTVVSLRGAPDNSYWTAPQKEILEKNNVRYDVLWWHSHYFPNQVEFRKYIDILKEAPRPILVHCRSGADRTGEASAIYKIEFMGKNKEDAISEELAVLRNWHVPIFHPAKRALVREYKGFDWALHEYDPCAPENKQYAEPGQCS